MADLAGFAATTFIAIFAIVNPVGAMTFFVVLTRSYPPVVKKRVIEKAVLAATVTMLTYADRIFHRVGRMGAYAISRIMGLILAAIAVQFVILGIQGAIAQYFLP